MPSRSGVSIGVLAAASGTNLETVRYYERIGLMPEPPRTEGGHRLYERVHAARLTFIRRARELGFGIEEIRALLDLAEPKRRSCEEVRTIVATHLTDVRAKLDDLKRLEAVLAQTLEACDAQSSAPSCPLLEILEAPNWR